MFTTQCGRAHSKDARTARCTWKAHLQGALVLTFVLTLEAGPGCVAAACGTQCSCRACRTALCVEVDVGEQGRKVVR